MIVFASGWCYKPVEYIYWLTFEAHNLILCWVILYSALSILGESGVYRTRTNIVIDTISLRMNLTNMPDNNSSWDYGHAPSV